MNRRFLVLAAVLAGAILACGPPRPDGRVVYDFVRFFPVAESHADTLLIDFGTAAARDHLEDGWSGGDEAGSFLWGVGPRSGLRFEVLEPRPLELRLRARAFTFPDAPPQDVTLELNDEVVGTARFGLPFEVVAITLPEAAQRQGVNQLSFVYAYATSPAEAGLPSADRRPLAVAWDRLRLVPPGTPSEAVETLDTETMEEEAQTGAVEAHPDADPPVLSLPPGSRVEYSLRLDPGTDLVIERLVARSGATGRIGGQLSVRLEVEDAAPVEFEMQPGEGERRFALPGQGLARLTFVARADVDDTAFDGLHLVRPTLQRPGPKIERKPEPNVQASLRKEPINVLLYVIDTLRADHLGCYGYGRPTSPRIDAFAADATLFKNAVAQSSWTRPAIATLLTGLSPRVHGAVRRKDALARSVPTLAGLLAQRGYATAGFTANGNVTPAFGFGHDFDVYEYLPERRDPEVHHLADEVHRPALAWLDQRPSDRPFFLFVHTVDPHVPYVPRMPFRDLFARPDLPSEVGTLDHVNRLGTLPRDEQAALRQDLIDLYDGEIAFNDHQFGLLLEALEDRGLTGSTLVVLVSDHGEEFLDHSGWQHGRSLYREQLHVPLVIRFPRHLHAGVEVDTPVRQLDVFPTILEAAGVALPPSVEGRPLQGQVASGDQPSMAIYSHLLIDGYDMESVLFEGRQLIRYQGRRRELPSESFDWTVTPPRPIPIEEEGLRRPFLEMLLERDEYLRPAANAPEDARIDPELRERLQALGYLEAGSRSR